MSFFLRLPFCFSYLSFVFFADASNLGTSLDGQECNLTLRDKLPSRWRLPCFVFTPILLLVVLVLLFVPLSRNQPVILLPKSSGALGAITMQGKIR
eukprot:g34210.t1